MAVDPKDILKYQIERMLQVITAMIDDITEEESVRTIGTSPNHIKWQTGHLVFSPVLATRAMGGQIAAPDGWDRLFRRGGNSPGPAENFPPMEQLRSTLYDFKRRALAQVDEASEEQLLTRRLIIGTWEETPLNAVLFLCGHEFYHCGQIALIRRELGRERVFG